MLPVTLFSMTDLVVGPGGVSTERYTDLYRLGHEVVRAVFEILGVVGAGFFLVHNNTRPHVARVCRQFLGVEEIDTTDRLAIPTSSRTPLGHHVLVHPPGCTSIWPGGQWCPGSDLRFPRTTSIISLETQCPMLSGMHTSMWRGYKLLIYTLPCPYQYRCPAWFFFFSIEVWCVFKCIYLFIFWAVC